MVLLIKIFSTLSEIPDRPTTNVLTHVHLYILLYGYGEKIEAVNKIYWRKQDVGTKQDATLTEKKSPCLQSMKKQYAHTYGHILK